MSESLWGDEFVIKETPKRTKKIIEKVNTPKENKVIRQTSTKKSKDVNIQDTLRYIYNEVDRILGKYKEKTIVIKSKEQLIDYIDNAIKNNIIAIDTETNNSLDPITCKLMGPCIYTPGQKNAYIPINHVDPVTRERLDWQLTEQDIYEQFDKLKNVPIIMHNGKFDYEVIKCTCGNELSIYWDTMIAARILDENERRAGLKEQYIDKIDPSQEKYNIEHLFEGIEYAVVDPEVFALYSATDPYMTYMLYDWQLKQFNKQGNEKLFSLFMNVEMPVVKVIAEMELTGVCIDKEYSERLSKKYHKKSDEIDNKINIELDKYKDTISNWRNTEEANFHPKGKTLDINGNPKEQKSKNEQLRDPVEVTSPTQLAILLYDVLKTPVVDDKTPRGTGEEILKKINLPICKLILEKRGIEKLINTYIDKLPQCVCEKDNRLHAHFNQCGTDTGRLSSTDPNLQNIPSHEKSIRLMFKAGYTEKNLPILDNYLELYNDDEIETNEGWKECKDLKIGNEVITSIGSKIISNIIQNNETLLVYFKEVIENGVRSN